MMSEFTFAGLLLHAVLGALATVGFAVWFNLPRETLPRAVFVGACGFVVRYVLLRFHHAPPIASFWAAFAIGVIGFYQTRTFSYPRVIFTVTGIIPLVPGIPAHEAITRFAHGEAEKGLQAGIKATVILWALAGGLTAARVVVPSRKEHA